MLNTDESFLGKKTSRIDSYEQVILGVSRDKTRVDYRAEDNVDMFRKHEYTNKLRYDILQLPDVVPKNGLADIELNTFRYNLRENIRVIKPIIYNEGRSMTFTLNSDVFVDRNTFSLNIMVTNPHKTNWLQYDCSLIKQISISNNGQIIDMITDYHIINDLLNDITYNNNVFESNNLNENNNLLSKDTKGIIIPPVTQGTHSVFNPSQLNYDYQNCNQIKDGKLSFSMNNTRIFNVKLNSFIFGPSYGKSIQTIDNLNPDYIPMFLYSCLQINIELNEYAFFVPLFRASPQDLTDVSIDDDQYEYRRMIKEQKDLIKEAISRIKLKNRVFSNFPKTNINAFNKDEYFIEKASTNKFDDFYKILSLCVYGDESKFNVIKSSIRDYFKNEKNAKEVKQILADTTIDHITLANFENKAFKNDSYTLLSKTKLYDLYSNFIDQIAPEKIATANIDKISIDFVDLNRIIELYCYSEIVKMPIEIYIKPLKENEIKFLTLINGYFMVEPIKVIFALSKDADSYLNVNTIVGLLKYANKIDELKSNFINVEDIFNLNELQKNDIINAIDDMNYNLKDQVNFDFLFKDFQNFFDDISKVDKFKIDISDFLYCLDKKMILFKFTNRINFDNITKAFQVKDKKILNYFNMSLVIKDDYYYTNLLNGIAKNNFIYAILLDENKKLKNVNYLVKYNSVIGNDFINEILEKFIEYIKKNNPEIKDDDLKYVKLSNDSEIMDFYEKIKNYVLFDATFNESTSVFLNMQKNKSLNLRNYNTLGIKIQVINEKFIMKLVSSYGSVNAFQILKFIMPDLFNWKKDEVKVMEYLEKSEKDSKYNYDELKELINPLFLKKFNSMYDIINYNPFSKYETIFSTFNIKPMSFRRKLHELTDKYSKINFDLKNYEKYGNMPFLGLLLKLVKSIKINKDKLIGFPSGCVFECYPFEQVRNNLIKSLTNENNIENIKDVETSSEV